jgi:hypothetical protein
VPYAPQVEYRGDRYIAEAGNQIGSSLSRGFENFIARNRAEDQDDAWSQTVFNSANGLLSEDERRRFLNGNPSERKGIAIGLIARRAQDWQQKEAEMRWGRDPREGIPQPLVLPDGSSLPGRYYIPGSRSVIDTNPQATAPPLGQEVVPGFIWNGRTLIPKTKTGKGDEIGQLEELTRTSRLNALNQEIASLKGELAGGNQRPGPDWVPWLTTPYADRVKQLEVERDALMRPSSPQPRDPSAYADPGVIPPTTSQPPAPLSPTSRQVPTPLRNAAPAPGDVLDQARDAIRRGASRDAVISRLQNMGIDPAGL